MPDGTHPDHHGPDSHDRALPAEIPAPAEPEGDLRTRIVAALKTVYDPEIPVDIWELGLIYSINITDDGDVAITMTVTAPACPVAGEMPGQVEQAVASVDGVESASVELVWDPPWDPSLMSDEARVALNMF